MLELTKQDYYHLMSELGSDEDSFEDTNSFLNWIYSSKNNLTGIDFATIEKFMNTKFGTNVSIYNKKERTEAKKNAYERLRCFLLEIDLNAKSEDPSTKTSTQSVITAPVSTLDKTIDYSSLMSEIGFLLSKNPKFAEDKDIDCTGNNVHYKGKAIIVEDGIGLVDFNSNIYSDLLTAIINKENKVMAVGKLRKCDDDYRIVTNTDSTIKESWGSNTQFKVLLFPKVVDSVLNLDKYVIDKDMASQIKYVSIKITERQREKSQSPLCIDFGTSNTTAGYFVNADDDSNRFVNVKFINPLNEDEFVRSDIIPTLIYVKRCDSNDSSKNKYLFGYDARKSLIEHDYIPDASIFFEIKRWFGIEPNKVVTITDENGNEAEIKYSELIKAYLLHIIEKSEDDLKLEFNKIHFTSPVKLKTKFIRQFQEMFKDTGYEIIDKDDDGEDTALDEGISVIYETVRNNIRDEKIDFKDTNMMVIDCGGGTTDVASCSIKREINNGIENLTITTKFVGGEANFGGNNITYRIMQLIKIKLAYYYWKEIGENISEYSTSIKELIPSPEEVLDCIDKGEYRSVYKKLEDEYSAAEELIPTRFEDNNQLTKYAKKKSKIKRNFYYLWNLAELIKTEFYKKEQLTLIGFANISDKTMDENYENILNEHAINFSIYIRTNEENLENRDINPQISITAQEVNDLIRGDIYNLLNRIFYNNENTDYEFYRFSGQSCKIRLFNELMREFIAGKKLRDVTRNKSTAISDDKNSEKLKTTCMRGIAYYEYDTKFGNIKPRIVNSCARFTFSVFTEFNGKSKVVLDEKSINLIPIPRNTMHLNLRIKDRFNEEINLCTLNLLEENKELKDSGEIEKLLNKNTTELYIKNIIQKISEAEAGRYCFAFPSTFGFELFVMTIKKVKKDGKATYFRSAVSSVYVENSSQTFFDGNK